jgi:hypothetical protein
MKYAPLPFYTENRLKKLMQRNTPLFFRHASFATLYI